MKLLKNMSIFLAIMSLVCCKYPDTGNTVESVNNTFIEESQKDIYINREFYAGNEVDDVEVIKTETTQIDSISYSLYKIRNKEAYIFSLEKFLKNDDVKKFRILDTLNLKTPRIQVEIKNTTEESLLNLIQNEKALKTWTFKTKMASSDTKIVHSLENDFNEDGFMDKIEVYENKKGSDNFEQTHFNLPLRIFKGLPNNEFQLWTKNDKLIFKNTNGCMSEGFMQIRYNSPYLSIEANTCYDNISVSAYITFKVDHDAISLYTYHETYFDKVDHDNEIPEMTWTADDFGDVPFEKVTTNLLLGLRKQY